MRADRKICVTLFALVLGGLLGCGPSREELAERERARLELERQAQADAAKANKAITDMNKKMFSRMNASRTGAPVETKSEPSSPSTPAKSEAPKP